MELEPGAYKIRIKNGMFDRTAYLRIFVKGGKKYYLIDHGGAQELSKEDLYLDEVQIVKKQLWPVAAKNVKVKVVFEDDDGDELGLVARDAYALERIFQRFPSIGKALGLKLDRRDSGKHKRSS